MIKQLSRLLVKSTNNSPIDPECQEKLKALKQSARDQGINETLLTETLALAEAYPQEDSVLRLLAKFQLAQGQHSEAEKNLLKSTQLNKDNALNWDAYGLCLLQQNRAEEADRAFEKAIKLDGKNPVYHHHRGLALSDLNWYLRAARAQQQAIRLDMDFAEAHNALGMAFTAEKQFKQATTAFKFAVKAKPDYKQAWRNLALALKRNRKPEEAIKMMDTACKANPDDLEMIKYTAWMNRETGNSQAAVDLLQQQIDDNHLNAAHDSITWFDLAESHLHLEDYHAAQAACQKGLELDADSSLGWSMQGSILMALQKADEAEAAFRKALESQADNDHLLGQLGLALDVLGKQAEAQQIYAQALDINPDNYDVLTKSITFRKADESDAALIKKLEKQLGSLSSQQDKTKLRFALGKLHDDLKQHSKAFTHYHAGNQIKFLRFDYDFDAIGKTVDALIEYFQPEKIKSSPWPDWQGNQNDQPVFIVGMPRSGTSLIEQIIASHPQAIGAGELPTLPRLMKNLAHTLDGKPDYPALLDQINEQQIQGLTDDYMIELHSHDQETSLRITDKLPYNFFHVGLINWLYPNARIIHCQRDPMDTCISCYFQNFTIGNEHTFDLEALGEYYLQYQRLMEHWEHVLPDNVINIQYEQVVSDTETQARQLIEKLGLDWDPGCLEFHKTKRKVQTASAWQVRQKIYQSSTKKWERYGDSFELLKEKLEH